MTCNPADSEPRDLRIVRVRTSLCTYSTTVGCSMGHFSDTNAPLH
jgi:hypothetical protein